MIKREKKDRYFFSRKRVRVLQFGKSYFAILLFAWK